MFGRFPARSGFTTFWHQKVAPKVSAGHLRRDRTKTVTERSRKICAVFARSLRAFPPLSDPFPPPVQCGDSCALCAMIIIRLRPHMAGLRPAGSHCEKSGKIPTLHCIPPGMTNPVILRRKSKPIPTQASPPASPSKQRRKRPCPIGFRHICPKTEK